MARANTVAKLLLCLLSLCALCAHTAMASECDAECARLVGAARAEAKAAASACSSAQERLTGQLTALKKEQANSAEALAAARSEATQSIQSLADARADLQRLANGWMPPALALALKPVLERGQSLLAGALGALREQIALANSNLAKSTFDGSALQDVYARALAAVRRGVAVAETYAVTLGASVRTTGMSRLHTLAAQLPSIDTSRLRTQAAQAVAHTSEELVSRVAPLAAHAKQAASTYLHTAHSALLSQLSQYLTPAQADVALQATVALLLALLLAGMMLPALARPPSAKQPASKKKAPREVSNLHFQAPGAALTAASPKVARAAPRRASRAVRD